MSDTGARQRAIAEFTHAFIEELIETEYEPMPGVAIVYDPDEHQIKIVSIH